MCTEVFRVVCSRTLVPLVLMGIAVSVGYAAQDVPSYWCDKSFEVDGQMTEWTELPLTSFEDSGVGVGFSNDGQELYILFCFRDAKWMRAISMSGLTVWLDNSKKKKKDLGIRYSGGSSIGQMRKAEETGKGGFWESMPPEAKERLMQRQATAEKEITIIDKKSKKTMTVPADGSCGPVVRYGSSKGVYVYEFGIPLEKSSKDSCYVDAKPGQTICVGFEWGGMDTGERKRMMEEMGGGKMGGMPPGGGGMPPGGGGMGRGGGRPTGGPGGDRPMGPPEKQEIWVKVTLASGPPGE